MRNVRRALWIGHLFIFAGAVAIAAGSAHADRKRKPKMAPAPDVAAPAPMEIEFGDDMIGATPGGAKDISFFRDRVAAGEIPHPNVFTPEGLFSEHDLPLEQGAACKQLFCITGEAMEAGLIVQPEVRYLAQIGFTTNLKASTFVREPLNLVAVVDKSGSMSGQPLELVKDSLLQVVSQLGPKDQLSIVLYGDTVHVHLAPTKASDKKSITKKIASIASAGSTDMESGLLTGFELARESRKEFRGMTRVMLFTDERPNVGRTDAKSFMGMAEAASKDGIGMTTVGVGVQFGAELATKISSVRGGNLFFFPDATKMKQVFLDELDMMVTELAYDMELVVAPAAGMKIAGVYGIPGKALEWTKDGAIKLKVATIFLSKKKGGIFISVAPDGASTLPEKKVAIGDGIATAAITYLPRGAKTRAQATVNLGRVEPKNASTGLLRGLVLVDQATVLKEAAAAHHERNDQERAYQLVHALASIMRQNDDPDLDNEREMVANLERTLAKLSGHAGEPSTTVAADPDPVTGLPPRPSR